jgi:8-oxo-dGTP diphosphatase
MMKGEFIVASGPVIVEEGKLLLVNSDDKDDFYKLPGGRVHEGESLEETCIRRTKEENNADIEIIKPLSPMILWENPQTKEKVVILLIHYKAKLLNKEEVKPMPGITKEVTWINIEEIKSGKIKVAPNIKFLLEKGELV